MKARIGINYTSAIHQSAGIGRYTRELVSALLRLPPESFVPQYHLFSAQVRSPRQPPYPQVEWHPTRLSERWLHRLWYRLRLPLPIELWTGPLALFHAPDFTLPPTRPATRTVVTIHDLSFAREPASVMPGMTRFLNRWVPDAVQRADHVVAVSEATRRDLIDLYRTPPEKITVLYHGVTPDFSPVADPARLAAVRRKYRLDGRPFILSVGTVQPRKNYRRLIQAVARLDCDVTLVIVGGWGWDYEPIQAEVVRQALTGRVRFLGFVADAELPALYSAATALVYPSLYEGFGLPVLEAMACGTPVIVANRSALPELVAGAGLLVEPTSVDEIAAALTRLLADPALQQQLAAAGLARAAQFSWSKTAAQLHQLYHEIIQRG